MSVTNLTYPKFQATDDNGNPLSGGKLYSYLAGTTTPVSTYADAAGTTLNPNPVILDSRGDASIYLDPTKSYKFILKDENDTEIWSIDNYNIGLATTDLSNVKDESITSEIIGIEAINTDRLQGGFVRAKDIFQNSMVLYGLGTSIDAVNAAQINVNNGAAVLKQANGSFYTYQKVPTSFIASTAGATYYLYILTNGNWWWDVTPPTDANALPIAKAIVDSTGAITTLNDTRIIKYINLPPIQIDSGTNAILANFGSGIILAADSDVAYSKQIAINDGTGNFTIRSNWSSYTNTYITNGNGAVNIEIDTDYVNGAISMQVAPIGTPGATIVSKKLYINSDGIFTWDGADVFTTANSPSGATYTKFVNGTIIQYGMGVAIAATSSVVVTLPTAFTTAVYLAMAAEAGTGSDNSVGLDGYTLSTITIYNPSGYARTANWIAIGK